MARVAIAFLLGAVACGRGGEPRDAADREAIARLTALRDRACACTTPACYGELTRELDLNAGALGSGASPAQHAAVDRLIDELLACGRRLAIDPPQE